MKFVQEKQSVMEINCGNCKTITKITRWQKKEPHLKLQLRSLKGSRSLDFPDTPFLRDLTDRGGGSGRLAEQQVHIEGLGINTIIEKITIKLTLRISSYLSADVLSNFPLKASMASVGWWGCLQEVKGSNKWEQEQEVT